MAATQAFLSSRASQANLSASAAAQALRTMSPPPTPVDQVQTKRMIQRQASSGSLSSSARGRGRGGLQRHNSAGSMTERTFRTPSPSPSRPVSRSEPQAPPLPTIPQQFTPPSTTSVKKKKKKKKRASSQEAPPPRVLSPPLVRPQTRGQSLDRYGSPQQQPLPPPPPPNFPKNNSLPQNNDLERVDSRNSINFSRPLSPRPQSPVAQSPMAQSPVLINGDRPHPDAVARAISPAEAADIQYDLAQTANQPVKKKKKKVVNGAVEGSYLQSATMGSRPVVNPLERSPEPQIQALSDQQPLARKKKKKPVFSEENPDFPTDTSRTDSDSDSNIERKRERRTQRASGVLQKQPSIVREDWEGEQQEQASPPQARQTTHATLNSAQESTTPVQDKRPTNATGASRKIESAVPPPAPDRPRSPEMHAIAAPDGREESPASMSHLQVTEHQPIRGASLSPSRSTRFSERLSSDLAAGRKHEPPPRSISPAKPALKHHSPAPAFSGGEPRGSSVTPSESSDISSASADGLPKRKKSVRVSFEVQPEVVGTAASVQSPAESPGKEKKGWLGLGKGKPVLNTVSSNDDMEELMKPRPQLPSFGSVRGQKFRDINDSNTAPIPRPPPETRTPPVEGKSSTTSGTSSETSSNYNPYSAAGVSSDHAVGAVFAQEARKTLGQTSANRSNEPLPPEVTSVEGTVSFSDEENDTSGAEETVYTPPARIGREGEARTDAKTTQAIVINQPVRPAVEQPLQTEVPVVSVSPPTPAEELKPNDQYLVEVPGGFPLSAEHLGKRDELSKGPPVTIRLPDLSSRTVAEVIDEDESDNDSIYSDAAEDPSEMEGMGFGSIDAIVESPIVTPPALLTSPESPLARVSPSVSHDALDAGSWEETQARWSGIAEQTRYLPSHIIKSQPTCATAIHDVEQAKRALEHQPVQERTPEAATTVYNKISQPVQPRPTRPPTSQPKRKKKSPAAIAAAASAPAAAAATQGLSDSPLRKRNQPSAYPTIDGPNLGYAAAAAAPFRQSMRASSSPEAEPGFRKTLRNENRNSMPVSMVSPQQQRASQPLTSIPPTQSRSALQKKHIPSAAAAAISAPAPRTQPVRPVVTNDSDSESSFRKARRSKSTTGGKYTMRRSMRGPAQPSLRGDRLSGIRSVSPVGRRPFSSDGSHTMRHTMRASIDNVPTLRGSTDFRRSSSLFARQQTGKAPTLSMSMGGQNNRSRTLDSDDEDEHPQRSKWRSRFADDSDDEIDVPQFAPVRGIPRGNNDDESTDLDDSSDEERAAPKAQATPKLQIPQVGSPAPLSSAEAVSPSSEKKRGILGIFRSKKPKEEGLSPVVESPQMPAKATDTTKASRLGFASTAERDRVIAQTRAKLEAAKEQQNVREPQHGHAKLHRRHGPERIMSDSWPLPPALPNENPRPSTADGPLMRNGTTRLNQGSMRKPHEVPEVVGRSGKKKKFPLLRKAFGLKD
ncbi:uncharacterized protein A1O5_10639 [Cladophialophora psammophila CBS 110553]|uniref:Uncharacterized protein n=1 Tax=Cladophialophora psammophila CBS 110553 TaxID=1182543 RepID=W9WLZ6_9EURO|nr:uncharacterized protein A1O5_10639 [Cladophialophora psammophila CBS 110553]EXJ66025.1 hypothetical protein A1O5_10639 [Cladophialophora psammophila CBS 110553]